ncbi:MAG: TonB-dependent receptor [Tannerella sp.]|jgi:TonB-linked SusC/RagA family outer membrane protein|nr:TonB-dependent receptor [Tannerella sp.]
MKVPVFYSIMIFLMGICNANADSYSQTALISLDVQSRTIKEVFTEIEKKTEYVFFFSNDINSYLEKKVSMKAKSVTLDKVLADIFADASDLTYSINDRQVVIAKKSDEPLPIMQQSKKTLTGIVIDASGEPIVGANIVEKGTTNGVASDAEGKFTLDIDNRAVLQVSYIGYIAQEVSDLDNSKPLIITLIEDNMALEEVIVVGYGVQKKVNMTGAVSSVDVGKIEDRPLSNLSGALAGLASGLVISQSSGSRPGYDGAVIRIRGQGTLNDSNPLVVIDGAVGSIGDLNPQDVENISVLKDASSAAIYGSRAANGVILITTRQGKSGTAKLTYQGSITGQQAINKMNIVSNYADFMELQNEASRNTGLAPRFSQGKIDEWRADGGKDLIKYPNTDWQDEFFRTGWMQNHTISATGGTDKMRYFLSANYLNNPGIVLHSEFKRYSLRTNLDANLKSWLTVGVNLFGYVSEADPNTVAISQTDGDAVFGGAVGTTPGQVLKHPDGRLGGPNNPEDEAGSGNNNPFRRMNFYKHNQLLVTHKLVPRLYGIIKPLKGLSLEGSYTYNYYDQEEPRHLQDVDLWNFYSNTISRVGTVRTYIDVTNQKSTLHQMDAIARYEFDVNKLKINVLLGASQEKYNYHWTRTRKYDLLDPVLTVYDATTADARVTGNLTEWAMHSYFGRLNLNWEDKYMLEANFRNDGSSRFASGDHRWGFFPSFSAGWRISEEAFMKDYEWLSMLKLRASYGSLGNNYTSTNYMYQTLYAAANYVLNSSVVGGLAQTTLSNQNLTWETTNVTNIGADFGVLGNRLTGSIELFNKNTEGILISLPVPLVHGTSVAPNQNAAKVNNKGFELNLDWKGQAGKVSYNIGGNFSFVKNEVVKFRDDVPAISGTNMVLEGQSINIQYVLEVDRIVQTDADLALVQSMIDKNPAAFASYARPQKGDFLFKDIDGDGRITPDDRVKVGWGTNPLLSYGLNLGAAWKGIDFSALLQGVGMWKVYFYDDSYRFTVTHGMQINKTIADGRWYEGRTDAKYPRLLTNTDNRNNQASTAFIFDKSYVRLKNIQLGYVIPQHISRLAFVDKLRIYSSIENAFTFTNNYPGLDPELSSRIQYPTMINYSFGLNLTF